MIYIMYAYWLGNIKLIEKRAVKMGKLLTLINCLCLVYYTEKNMSEFEDILMQILNLEKTEL